MFNITAGDVVAEGETIIVEDNPHYTVIMTREGPNIRTTTITKHDTLQAVLDENAAEASEFNATGKHSDIVKVAGIPVHLYYEWLKEGIIDDPKALAKRLNSSDYAKFRTNSWSL
jgi:UPF0288 family protein (methanogenesis marker protein 3)